MLMYLHPIICRSLVYVSIPIYTSFIHIVVLETYKKGLHCDVFWSWKKNKQQMLFLLPWLFLPCIQNTVLIKTICNQYNEWIITVTHTHTLPHTTQGVDEMQKQYNATCFHLAPGPFFLLFPSLGLQSGGRGGLSQSSSSILLLSTRSRPRSHMRCPSSRPSSRRRRNCTPHSLREEGEKGSCELSPESCFILPEPLTRCLFSHPRLPGWKRGTGLEIFSQVKKKKRGLVGSTTSFPSDRAKCKMWIVPALPNQC